MRGKEALTCLLEDFEKTSDISLGATLQSYGWLLPVDKVCEVDARMRKAIREKRALLTQKALTNGAGRDKGTSSQAIVPADEHCLDIVQGELVGKAGQEQAKNRAAAKDAKDELRKLLAGKTKK